MPDDALVTDPVRVRASAKLTLSLRVLGTRPDGFHELDALVVSLDRPADLVEVALRGDGRVTLQVARSDAEVPPGADNLVAQAARLLLRRVEPGAGARLRLKKQIPTRAGLGGGSADAAAALRAIARLLPAETAGLDLEGVGAELGSDVPFCVVGGLARMSGRGERIERLGPPPELAFLVAVPEFGLSTEDVYRAWDELGGPTGERVAPVPRALEGLVGGADGLSNDLEPAALFVEPRLAEFRAVLEGATGGRALLAGSGSALAVAVDAADADVVPTLPDRVTETLVGEGFEPRLVTVGRACAEGVVVLES